MCFPCPPSSLLFCNRAHASAHSLNPLESAQADKGSLRGHTYTYAHAWICFCVALGISEPPPCSKPLPYLSHTSLQNPDIRWFCCLQYLETNHSYISQLYSIQSAPYSPVALTALSSVGQEAEAYKNSHSHQREPQRGERERGEHKRLQGSPPSLLPPPPSSTLPFVALCSLFHIHSFNCVFSSAAPGNPQSPAHGHIGRLWGYF